MSIAQYGKRFPILLTMSSPRGKVDLLETIGKGNYGHVYKGKLLETNTIAAIKVVFLKEDELRETLLEMEILAACKHPNITRLFGCFLKGLDLWICMEFCGGGGLDVIYKTLKKPLTEDQIAAILFDTLLALDYLHTKVALIHRDIKAGNVFLTEDGQVKLGDFGVSAKLANPSATASTFIGTPYWMAPEVIMTDPDSPTGHGASYDTKADIWSIGITAIEIAEKNPPLSDIHPMRALQLIPKSELGLAKPKNFSKPLVDFIAQCLTKNPVKRPSAAELLEHPFFAKVKNVQRQRIVAEMVSKVRLIQEKKRAGQDFDDDEDEIEKREEVPPAVIADTMHQAHQAKSHAAQQITAPGPSPLVDLQNIGSPNDFPAFINTVQNPESQVFNPTAIVAVRNEYHTADILDGLYLLLGCDKGLFFLDLSGASFQHPVPLIRGVRFRQIQILHDYGVLLALSGKRDHVRQYKLPSIRRLIRYLLGDNVHIVAKMNMNLPIPAAMSGNASQQQFVLQDEDDEYANAQRDDMGENALIARWTSDYIKLVATRESRSFIVEKTETTIYLTVLFKQDITLFEWAKEPYLKFMKLKAFWLPEFPQFIKMYHDGLIAREICLGYLGQMNMIDVDSSKVREIPLHRDLRERVANSTKPRWRNFVQIPLSKARLEELVRNHVRPGNTVNRKIVAVTGPSHLKSGTGPQSDRYFLATYDRITKVTDGSGQPQMGSGVGGWKDGVIWTEAPIDMVLRPLEHVISMGANTIEIVDWKSARL
eukprot:jgi/Hompol1/1901/HPOL_004992-RA